jgi:hypothetical protein
MTSCTNRCHRTSRHRVCLVKYFQHVQSDQSLYEQRSHTPKTVPKSHLHLLREINGRPPATRHNHSLDLEGHYRDLHHHIQVNQPYLYSSRCNLKPWYEFAHVLVNSFIHLSCSYYHVLFPHVVSLLLGEMGKSSIT